MINQNIDIWFKFKSKYTFVFFTKLTYGGKICYDFDLIETLLIVYSKMVK